jgi:hypothetical protein
MPSPTTTSPSERADVFRIRELVERLAHYLSEDPAFFETPHLTLGALFLATARFHAIYTVAHDDTEERFLADLDRLVAAFRQEVINLRPKAQAHWHKDDACPTPVTH